MNKNHKRQFLTAFFLLLFSNPYLLYSAATTGNCCSYPIDLILFLWTVYYSYLFIYFFAKLELLYFLAKVMMDAIFFYNVIFE